ncbi:MAG: NAD-dependent epimerase [Acidobacteria bacterium]|nr:NAD-dependent epimerase [Acidobacteriota bacterium]MBU4306596.1 NAD-dependent epimerase [Acidobacteriota bacterium]MCG2812574.1 NAD-dependent epimerase [Candidatus Aminicenantes bacterium]
MSKTEQPAAEKTAVLLTGIAGFIGFHFARRLMAEGHRVIGIDNVNDYYDVDLKYARLRQLGFSEADTDQLRLKAEAKLEMANLVFYKADLQDREKIAEIFTNEKPQLVVHLAAQAGVRYSLENPWAYMDSNIIGFMNILENCRRHPVRHLVYASSSSVYGGNQVQPFSVRHNVDHPLSLYAASKKANELMAHSYSHLFRIPTSGLRFFTVYGPWGRPDMALFIFTQKIMRGEAIEVYNFGNMKRDFTYIDDIVEGVWRVMNKIPESDPGWDGMHPDPASAAAPYRLFNIGNQRPVDLLHFVGLIEKKLGREAKKILLPMQPGDVKETCADIEALRRYVGFAPATPIETGVARFVEWYTTYYGK